MPIAAQMPQEGGPREPQSQIFFQKTEKIIQNAKTQKCLEICQNQRYALRPEVSNPSGSVVSGWTKNTKKPDFFEKRKKSSKTQKLKIVQRYAKISDMPFDQKSLIHLEAWVLPCFIRQNQHTKKLFFARRFQTTNGTDKHTDGRTFRLIESIGPEGRCFESFTIIISYIYSLINRELKVKITNW